MVPAGKPSSFYIDIPASDSFAYYSAAVETDSGGRKFAVPVSREQAKDPVQILLPANTLTPGNYVLVVRGVGQASAGQPTSAANVAPKSHAICSLFSANNAPSCRNR